MNVLSRALSRCDFSPCLFHASIRYVTFLLKGEAAVESGNHARKPVANIWLPQIPEAISSRYSPTSPWRTTGGCCCSLCTQRKWSGNWRRLTAYSAMRFLLVRSQSDSGRHCSRAVAPSVLWDHPAARGIMEAGRYHGMARSPW